MTYRLEGLTQMAKGVRKSITIPGLLAPTVTQRCAEFGHTIFTPYAVELVCYDLRSDANHTITLKISRDTQAAQDAVDRELVVHYRPGQPRTGLLVQLLERVGHLQNVAARNRHDFVFAPLSAVAKRITFPIDIWRLANPRWQKLRVRFFVGVHHRADSLRSACWRTARFNHCGLSFKVAAKADAENASRSAQRTPAKNPARSSH